MLLIDFIVHPGVDIRIIKLRFKKKKKHIVPKQKCRDDLLLYLLAQRNNLIQSFSCIDCNTKTISKCTIILKTVKFGNEVVRTNIFFVLYFFFAQLDILEDSTFYCMRQSPESRKKKYDLINIINYRWYSYYDVVFSSIAFDFIKIASTWLL
jgi:hypothetical protein